MIFSVPHAGREYPPELTQLARVSPGALWALEDRFADLLVPHDVTAIVAHTARAWIDLNRSEREFDPGLVRDAHSLSPQPSAKVRGGLGLVPRRLSGVGEIWRGSIDASRLRARIERYHRPYHEVLNASIAQSLARFGVAILVDLHSMPPIAEPDAPRFVVGDLFGRSAHARFSQAAIEVLGQRDVKVALNAPYPGGYITERHGRPHANVHALQVEVDRTLYLDARLSKPGSGLNATRHVVETLAAALTDEALATPQTIAAE